MTPNLQPTSFSNHIYEQDYCLWLETTAKLLRDRQLDSLDFEHLIEMEFKTVILSVCRAFRMTGNYPSY